MARRIRDGKSIGGVNDNIESDGIWTEDDNGNLVPVDGQALDLTDALITNATISDESVTTSSIGTATIKSLSRASVITANDLASNAGHIYPVDTNGGTVTLTLASGMVTNGATVIIKDEGGNAGTNAITIDTEGTETIDGSSSVSISSNYGSVRLHSDGTNWFVNASTGGGGTL